MAVQIIGSTSLSARCGAARRRVSTRRRCKARLRRGVHYLFNNAGVALAASFEHATIEEIEWQLSINLWGVIYGTKAFLPMMLDQREGCIINMCSVAGLIGAPGLSAYSISKFGVRGLTESLWRELEGTGVSAIAVHPGGIRTNIEVRAKSGVHAGDYEEKVRKALAEALVTPPKECARLILVGVERGRKRILPGKYATTLDLVSRLSPKYLGPNSPKSSRSATNEVRRCPPRPSRIADRRATRRARSCARARACSSARCRLE